MVCTACGVTAPWACAHQSGATRSLREISSQPWPACSARAPVDSCNTDEKEEVTPCVAGNVARAQQAGQGWLLISRADRLEPHWWSTVLAAIGPQNRQVIELPFRMVRAGTPPAHYDYVWHPAARQP